MRPRYYNTKDLFYLMELFAGAGLWGIAFQAAQAAETSAKIENRPRVRIKAKRKQANYAIEHMLIKGKNCKTKEKYKN